jgi:DNA-binding Lrp family transcriptional regulator
MKIEYKKSEIYLDEVDEEILSVVNQEGTIRFTELVRRVMEAGSYVSPYTLRYRVFSLEKLNLLELNHERRRLFCSKVEGAT